MTGARVEVWRGGLVESVHEVVVAVADASGRLRATAGDAQLLAYARSAAKPFQALPLVEEGVADRFSFTSEELALCCASHSGEPRHVAAARTLLHKVGAGEEALACGPHPPLGKAAAAELERRGEAPGRIHNNCSGKHAGMLALAAARGWPLAGYERPEHPVQRRITVEVARWTEIPGDEIATGTDGCGVVTFALPLAALASAYARFAAAAREGEPGPARILRAMVRNPEYVGGSDRLCTDLMRVAGGRILAKTGAEGVYCAAIPGAELGIALKVRDGATRASEPALLAVLRALHLLSDEEMAALERYARPELRNTRGERVGGIRAEVELEASDG